MTTEVPVRIADRLEIDDLLTRYTVAIDTKDWDLLATCFTPDAHIDYRASAERVTVRLVQKCWVMGKAASVSASQAATSG